MQERMLGRTGRGGGHVGRGAGHRGAGCGAVADPMGVRVGAVDAGVTFIDTADVYGHGRSETLIGEFLKANPGVPLTVATKMGRRVAQVPANYVMENFRS